MRKIIKCLGIIFFINFFDLVLYSQTTIDAEFRPRTEFRQGFRKPLADSLKAGFITFQRTRLNAMYKSKVLSTYISLQDARVWGASDLKTNTSKIELNEAWAEYLIMTGLSTQFGRQAINYDDRRLFSSPTWSNTGMAHDALVVKYQLYGINIHSGMSYNNAKDTLSDIAYSFSAKQNYKTLNYIWVERELFPAAKISLIGVCDQFQNTKKANTLYPRYTFGGNFFYASDSSSLGVTLTFYKQSGATPMKTYKNSNKVQTFAGLNAFFAAAKVSYKITDMFSPYLGAELYSGNPYTADSTDSKAFERLYGAPHSFNGYMEFFQTLPAQGLMDLNLGLGLKLSGKLKLDLNAHLFSFHEDFYYKKEKTDKSLGSEIDLTVNYTISKEIMLQAGYSRYFTNDASEKYFKVSGVDVHTPQWAYLMMTIRPQLYKTPVN